MDAVAFPPPPAPFFDDDDDFGDFAFAPAVPPQPAPQPDDFAAFDDDWGDFVAGSRGSNADGGPANAAAPPAGKPSAGVWEKPRGPLPLSLFGADEKEGEEEEEGGPVGPPPAATVHQRAPSLESRGSMTPADLKDLIAGLYGSQPPPVPDAPESGAPEVAEDDDGFGDDGWEFKAAPSSDAGQDGGGGRAHGDGVEDIPKPLGTNQEEWSLFTSVDNKLNNVQTTDHIRNPESTGESVKTFSYSLDNTSSILNLYKESNLVDAVHVPQSFSEGGLSSSDVFSSNEMNSSSGTDEDHSIKSASDSILIDFYNKLREESLAMMFQYIKDTKEAQKSSTHSDGNNKVTAIEREIQEILEKLQDSSVAEGSRIEEQPSCDAYVSELLSNTKEENMKDFEQHYHLGAKIAAAQQDMSLAVELYQHSVSTLHILELASKEERCDYVSAWYNMFLSCAQELQHGAVLWQESCRAEVSDLLISEGAYYFVALGEIYRVAQILHLSLQYFKPWVLADLRMLSKMLACWDSCTNAWTSGLETALKIVLDSNHLNASVVKALLESIITIQELKVENIQSFVPNELACRLTLLPTDLVPGEKATVWNGNHYFVKVANLWANRVSSEPPRFALAHSPQ
ncbi:uncharacterized protein LOC100824858 [Brachypodium distachyon]|uniref:Synergin gamma C-terminal domain-containing protein n=1 Tax=Brachypodium distachyon TaxID=15368 RepID=I1IUG1_BRADI|nr:uncharacterized protein LOC100824858 [Brachypodium distachyon]KQJ92313.1 hypothetical protein BRADI_4g42817v3 [Brachypodium distachyon]|eukprot:XP_003578923.1 uncharacterized protein LOC100824858 [Brachypodium distachyon]